TNSHAKLKFEGQLKGTVFAAHEHLHQGVRPLSHGDQVHPAVAIEIAHGELDVGIAGGNKSSITKRTVADAIHHLESVYVPPHHDAVHPAVPVHVRSGDGHRQAAPSISHPRLEGAIPTSDEHAYVSVHGVCNDEIQA